MVEKPSKNEDEYFAKRDAELLRQQRLTAQNAAIEAERRSHYMKCPKCGYDLLTSEWQGVQIDQCPNCKGIWFDAGEAESLITSDDKNLFSRVIGAVVRGVGGKRPRQ